MHVLTALIVCGLLTMTNSVHHTQRHAQSGISLSCERQHGAIRQEDKMKKVVVVEEARLNVGFSLLYLLR